MNIREAAIKANQQGRGMARRSWPRRTRIVIPTNTSAYIVGVPFKRSASIQREWRPRLNDLVATDWYVSG